MVGLPRPAAQQPGTATPSPIIELSWLTLVSAHASHLGESCVEDGAEQQAGDHNVGERPGNSGNTHFNYVVSLFGIHRAVKSSSIIPIWCGLLRYRLRHRYGTAPFRHRLGICYCNIFDLTSQVSFAGAKLSGLRDNTGCTG